MHVDQWSARQPQTDLSVNTALGQGCYMPHHLKPSQQLDSERDRLATALFHVNFMKLDSGSDFPKSQLLGSS